MAKLADIIKRLQLNATKIVTENQFKLNYYEEGWIEMKDLELLGNVPKNKDKEKAFRWGTREQLIGLDRKDKMGPLKLKQIKTRKADSSLGGLQLIFEGGIETELFDSGNTSNALVTYDVKDKPIK